MYKKRRKNLVINPFSKRKVKDFDEKVRFIFSFVIYYYNDYPLESHLIYPVRKSKE